MERLLSLACEILQCRTSCFEQSLLGFLSRIEELAETFGKAILDRFIVALIFACHGWESGLWACVSVLGVFMAIPLHTNYGRMKQNPRVLATRLFSVMTCSSNPIR